MAEFVHYIITSFNVGLYRRSWDTDKWMRERLRLFRQYTLPGMRRQTNQDFKWLVQFDPDTPEIPDFDYENIIITFYPSAPKYINNHLRMEWLITSRIDSDDYYEPTFIEEIQRCFKKREVLIDVNGRQLDDKTGKFYQFPRYSMDSPFLTLIEQRGYRTVKWKEHGKMKYHFPHKKINKELAVQVIHGGNLKNRLTKMDDNGKRHI